MRPKLLNFETGPQYVVQDVLKFMVLQGLPQELGEANSSLYFCSGLYTVSLEYIRCPKCVDFTLWFSVLLATEKQALASPKVVLPRGTAPAKPHLLTFVLHSRQKTRHAQLTAPNQSSHPDSEGKAYRRQLFRNQKGEAPGQATLADRSTRLLHSPPARFWAASSSCFQSLSPIATLEGRQNPSFPSTQATELRVGEPFAQCHTDAGFLNQVCLTPKPVQQQPACPCRIADSPFSD